MNLNCGNQKYSAKQQKKKFLVSVKIVFGGQKPLNKIVAFDEQVWIVSVSVLCTKHGYATTSKHVSSVDTFHNDQNYMLEIEKKSAEISLIAE